MTYQSRIEEMQKHVTGTGFIPAGIDAVNAGRMALQNPFPTGLDIARHTCLLYTSDAADE